MTFSLIQGRAALIILSVLFGTSHLAVAGSWRFSPAVDAGMAYTDNLFLDSTNEVNDLLFAVTPGFELEGLSRKLQLTADYSLQAVHYQGHSKFDDQYHLFNGQSRLALVDEHLFLDLSGSYSQSDIDLDQPGSGDNLSVTGNRTDVKIWNFSPYWQHRVANKLAMELRYGHRRLTDTDTTRTNSWNGFVQSLPALGPVSWRLDLSDRRQDYEFSPSARFRRGNLRASIPTWRHQQLIVDGGYENDDYLRAPGTDTPSGGTWALGYGWNPHLRTRFELTWGQRFFGDALEIHAEHGHRRWIFNLDYTQDPSSNAQSQLDNADSLLGSNQQLVDVGNQEIFIQKRFTSGVRYEGRRDRIRLNASRDNRDFQGSSGISERNKQISFDWQRDLNRRLRASVDADWQHRSAGVARNYRQWRVSAGLERDLSQDLSVYSRLTHVLREGRPTSSEYRGNTLSAGLTVNF